MGRPAVLVFPIGEKTPFQLLLFIEISASPPFPLPALYLDKLGNRLSKGWKNGLGGEAIFHIELILKRSPHAKGPALAHHALLPFG